jgi:P-type Mg2+ transporter
MRCACACTGDNILVAKKVCTEIGLDTTYTLTGDQMRGLPIDDEAPELFDLFMKTTVFARLSPTQKARVIRVLRLNGRIVGMLGDGVNDALALKESDCGVTVDTGADLAKEAADMILTEKSLAVLHHGIISGRRVHGNTLKYIKMTASSNFGNVFSVVIAAGWLKWLPMQPIQLLINNIIYDVSQARASERIRPHMTVHDDVVNR